MIQELTGQTLREAFASAMSASDEQADYDGRQMSIKELAQRVANDRTPMSSGHFKLFKAKVLPPVRQFIPRNCTYGDSAFYFLEVLQKSKLSDPQTRTDHLTEIGDAAVRDRAAMGELALDELGRAVAEKFARADIFIIV